MIVSADYTNAACGEAAISACRRFFSSAGELSLPPHICGAETKAQGRVENLNFRVGRALSIKT